MKLFCDIASSQKEGVELGRRLCQSLARRMGATVVKQAGRSEAIAALAGEERLGIAEIRILGRTSLSFAYSEGNRQEWKSGRARRCGPYRISVMDADLARGAPSMMLQLVRRCRD